MAPVTITVLYPNVQDATFNMEYYLQTHMPLAQQHFGQHGLIGYRVQKLLSTATGDPAPYSVMCLLEFPDRAAWDNAVTQAAGPVMADVANFSNKEPTFLIGEGVGGNVAVSKI
ncbi:uncharacterized protein J3D65DRAFT_612124 [Phyllosticta citribraziliensis]|uniref:EthD domain-containing protein n=1 Tax=Phyllosticta citribraziliensis TaxID=989973 RepID=A0ABR1M2Z0_9PEZI